MEYAAGRTAGRTKHRAMHRRGAGQWRRCRTKGRAWWSSGDGWQGGHHATSRRAVNPAAVSAPAHCPSAKGPDKLDGPSEIVDAGQNNESGQPGRDCPAHGAAAAAATAPGEQRHHEDRHMEMRRVDVDTGPVLH